MLTSYTVAVLDRIVVKLEPTGRESAMIIGKGIDCWAKAGTFGMFDHSIPAPCAESFVKKLSFVVPFRK